MKFDLGYFSPSLAAVPGLALVDGRTVAPPTADRPALELDPPCSFALHGIIADAVALPANPDYRPSYDDLVYDCLPHLDRIEDASIVEIDAEDGVWLEFRARPGAARAVLRGPTPDGTGSWELALHAPNYVRCQEGQPPRLFLLEAGSAALAQEAARWGWTVVRDTPDDDDHAARLAALFLDP